MIFDRLIKLFDMSDPSDYEDYYKNVSWKTFRVDESIWDENPRKRPKIIATSSFWKRRQSPFSTM